MKIVQQVTYTVREVPKSEVPKNKKVLHSEPKVLIMFIFFQIEFSTDALLV